MVIALPIYGPMCSDAALNETLQSQAVTGVDIVNSRQA